MDESLRHRRAAPLEVFWTLTGQCNLRCSFCMTGSGPTPPRPALDAAGRRRVLAELLSARVLKVYLTGGEPMVLPDFWELLAALLAAGIFVELTTNGTRLDAESCRRLRELGLPSLQVSLNGSGAAVNDALMGAGSFARIRAGLVAALAAGLEVHVRPTVLAGNVEDVPGLLEELASLGVKRVDLKEVSPLGRAAEDFREHRLDLAAARALEGQVREHGPEGLEARFESWSVLFQDQGHPAICSLGATRPQVVVIDEAGHLFGCSAAAYLGFDNPILEHGLIGAWERLEALGELRDPARLTGECRECELLQACRGGCRAAAARLTGDAWAPDPLCPRVGESPGVVAAPVPSTPDLPWKGQV